MKDKLIKIMIGFATVLILVAPMGLIHQSAMAAEMGGTEVAANAMVLEKSTQKSQKYDLVVIQDEEVPLASAPEHNYNGAVVWVVALILSAMILISYIRWYFVYKSRIMMLLEKLPEAEADKMRTFITILHPIKIVQTEKYVENRIASQFVK